MTVEEVVTTEYEDGKIFEQSRPEGYTIASSGASLKIKVAKNMGGTDPTDECDPISQALGQC